MRSIETTIRIEQDGAFMGKLPGDIPPGRHRAVLVIDDQVIANPENLTKFPVDSCGVWPSGLDLGRSAIYGDNGR
ncbi:MAG: hypothetical protein EPN26_01905 [Rhodospirillales bacterium]|nr:MAG: hypothetical protein EPN26_01905 [Rhodospirillales bacterium]